MEMQTQIGTLRKAVETDADPGNHRVSKIEEIQTKVTQEASLSEVIPNQMTGLCFMCCKFVK
jgi:hypothetical protein